MPHRAVAHYHPSHHVERHGSGDGRRPMPLRPPAPRPPIPAANGYTLGHAGRQVRIGPVAFWIVVGTLVIMASWSLATASYFAFREDVLTRLIGRQADQQFAYEDRIAELRAQIDRVTSRQLLDQEQFEQKLDQVLRRQAVLESRATALGSIADPTPTGSIRPPGRGATDAQPSKPSPLNDRQTSLRPGQRNFRVAAADMIGPGTVHAVGMDATITKLQASLDRVESRQVAILNAVEETFDSKAKRIRGVLGDLGLDPAKLPTPPASNAVGGPFVPFKLKPDSGPFERQLHRIALARTQVDRLTRSMTTVPVRQPMAGDIETTSGYGMRVDPFLRSPAMHTGLDYRGDAGDPVRATAAGSVVHSGWNGGYGKMVEIDHGNGLSTRYAHLSETSVTVGQTIKIGQVVGKLGSTGRSTGPHLHYETRVDGDAVDPQKFLRAGARLGSLD
jgi:murein DD-endopeptidase MepM/ murein hydrolase activator NlpD